MRYVITGGAGFIGSHIAEGLLHDGHEVVIFDNLLSGKGENIALLEPRNRVTFIPGSILDLPALKSAFSGADGIFHEAAIVSVPRSVADPAETHQVNLSGTLNVLLAARNCGVKNLVFASTAAVYGNNPRLPTQESMTPDPLSPYAVSKLASENYCSVFSRLYGVRCTSLRYFNVFGPCQDPASPYSGVITKFIANTLAQRPIVMYGDGNQTRDFVYVKDVVQANLRAMQAGKDGVFNVAGGKRINLHELVGMIAEMYPLEKVGEGINPVTNIL
ncbi:MAG: NAD-dependent epimerase/dehydratase family protein, partial [Methanomicrobiales archaeon]